MNTRIMVLALLSAMMIAYPLSAAGQEEGAGYLFGSKVISGDGEGRPLSPFPVVPDFAFVDAGVNGVFDLGDPVYLNMNPQDGMVSEGDIRLSTAFSRPGQMVRLGDRDLGYRLIRFGTSGFQPAELRYYDVNGDRSYGLEDPVYLDFNPGQVTPGDLRITGYLSYQPGSLVLDSDVDSGKQTRTLPGTLSFYNANGNVDSLGGAIFDRGDIVFIDTQFPFNAVTVNDVRLSA
ncbi:MAG: hypothetical protein A4E45_00099 [Methanosaeta sp. PtaB.Bin039]|nr:MAG: hypothetical protein A4E45_00099 [Methanosaeta sp. PtaB.Bin039]OPY47568.1 MAG: hypothetical protein A4E47_00222 [Methanosaeta sp. PtaU1.Bin028]